MTQVSHVYRARLLSASLAAPLLLGLLAGSASGQSYGLDDNPMLFGGFGAGAEDPFGFAGFSFAPSPTLVLGGFLDADILSPGPILQKLTPNGALIDSLSLNHPRQNKPIQLEFSVDRITPGVGALGVQFALGQAPADIFTTTRTFIAPGAFAGTLLPVVGTFAGFLPAAVAGAPSNTLLHDDGAFFGLLTSVGVVGPAVPVPPPVPTLAGAIGSHDNIDSWENGIFDGNGDGLMDGDSYFTIYPDEAAAVGTSPADIFAVAAGDPGAIPVPYAPAPFAGLDFFGGFATDSIDALVMFDSLNLPIDLNNPAAPGIVDPIADYALFSLAPGSASLLALVALGIPVDAADIFFTDFTGLFAVYASTFDIGVIPSPGAFPMQGSNVDGLDIIPSPASAMLMALGLAGVATRRRR